MTSPSVIALVLTAMVGISTAGAQSAADREAELVAAVAKRPSALEPYRELAQLYSLTGRREEGERILRQALAVHPDSGAVFDAMVSLYSNPRDPEKILAIAQDWTTADPANEKPLMLAVQVHMSSGARLRDQPLEAAMHFDRALQVVDEAIRLNPKAPMPRSLRMVVAKQRASVTQDPEERARLLREIEVAAQESSKMRGEKEPPPVSAEQAARFPKAIRVGGNVAPPLKTRDVRPQYPNAAREARVQGVVILEIVVAESGDVADARVLRSIPALDEAAIEAVRQWQFRSTLLNGEAVPVILTVTVQFNLPDGH